MVISTQNNYMPEKVKTKGKRGENMALSKKISKVQNVSTWRMPSLN